ncbi:cell envelope integrity protein CreD [Alteraurantiacibacter aquimixticola]|uniref:Cell envelope integrity protein CreD n=1 Tax=Alteraurantiacibacter aquimixticola TaxID=2489173 RepID=A0A4T3EZM9_9SPHN|nr:cell envelope integrity protein CreD [Alteraurantiacibacter aquimixticola]TIX50241.1 cell envelope integrity protein CreD [Alteraurantiacibacter aquimixticola]
MNRERSPGVKLLLVGAVAMVLIVPLLLVYALVYDRQSQSETAQASITAGWGGEQTVTGPVLVIPWIAEVTTTESVNGTNLVTTTPQRRELFVSPTTQSVATTIDPDRKGYAIYESVVFASRMQGTARSALPDDLNRLDVRLSSLLLNQAELRFGVSDPRGLTDNAEVRAGGEELALLPGNGPVATGGRGFSAAVDWDGRAPLAVSWEYGLRGSHSLALVPRGNETEWSVSSSWQHPSFTGFLPDSREIGADGFSATYAGITNLALDRSLVSLQDDAGGQLATIGLVDPVDLYSQVDRAVKYGFLFIGFTFATFLMFDIVGGARVASAEYLLTGAGLVLFFVMLLAFAEVVGFALAYVIAAGAIIGLLTAYSAAVLGTWKRASFIGAMLSGLYALLYVLLNLETYSLVIGSVLLFAALAGIMYATRSVDWSSVGRSTGDEEALA